MIIVILKNVWELICNPPTFPFSFSWRKQKSAGDGICRICFLSLAFFKTSAIFLFPFLKYTRTNQNLRHYFWMGFYIYFYFIPFTVFLPPPLQKQKRMEFHFGKAWETDASMCALGKAFSETSSIGRADLGRYLMLVACWIATKGTAGSLSIQLYE